MGSVEEITDFHSRVDLVDRPGAPVRVVGHHQGIVVRHALAVGRPGGSVRNDSGGFGNRPAGRLLNL